MADEPRPSNWRQATHAPAVVVELACSKCGAQNRPGAEIIAVDPNRVACCGVCSHAWLVP